MKQKSADKTRKAMLRASDTNPQNDSVGKIDSQREDGDNSSKRRVVGVRLVIVLLVAFLAVFFCVQLLVSPNRPIDDEGKTWHDVSLEELEGKGWKNTSEHFTRMPKHAKATVPEEVWTRSQHSAGLSVRFKTDASTISVRHEIGSKWKLSNMTVVGSSGLDMYAKDDNNVWRWVGSASPKVRSYSLLPQLRRDMPIVGKIFEKVAWLWNESYERTVIHDAPAQLREYQIYLPLYCKTVSLFIGIPKDCQFEFLPPSIEKPVLWYGTSIVHGCSASRPGMAMPAIIERRLQVPVINFGFAQYARMEIEMAELIAEVDASVFILDCMPNMELAHVRENTEQFIRKLRLARPDTPIVMVEAPLYSYAWIRPQWTTDRQNKCKSYRETFEKLQDEGMTGLTYIYGDELYGSDGDGTVDGVHPSDLGLFRNAAIIESALREILKL
jgi:hypothetical protein